jgi:raffinose/stachyose/melibiose transport system substrate-binding protein
MVINTETTPRRHWWRGKVTAGVVTGLVGASLLTTAGISSASTTRHAKPNGPTASITAWAVTQPGPVNNYMTSLAKKFDASHPGDHVTMDFIANTPFKQKILLAMGAKKPPALFFSWGGGVLDQYIQAGDVTSLGPTNASFTKHFLPSSLQAVTFNGKLYGLPIQGTQPVFFYYNKSLFKKEHLSFPKTWPQLLADVATFKKAGIIPIEMGNLSGWEGLMYLEYLTDRIGGPSVFNAIQAGKKNAWNNPAILKALADIQDLAKAGAFQKGFDAVDFGTETDALLYSGRAAMTLMGSWEVSQILGESPSFVTNGTLGQATFPTVPGGKGSPADLSGNTTDYMAVASHITPAQKIVAEQFLEQEFTTPSFIKTEVAAGQVPVLKGASAALQKNAKLGSLLVPIYRAVYRAPHFQYSWDQALGSKRAQPMLTNLEKVFELSETPKQFVSTLDSSSTGV